MPTRICLTPRCPHPPTYRGRCQRHAKQREAQTHPNKAFYNTKRWRTTRRTHLFNHPLCAHCQALATDVDHIIPIEQGGDRWAPTNLQGLCSQCHGRKTRREQGA